MRRTLFVIFLMLLGLVACTQESVEADPYAVSSEPGIVTVFKTPT